MNNETVKQEAAEITEVTLQEVFEIEREGVVGECVGATKVCVEATTEAI